MTINSALRASASGLHAERMRLDTISSNIANANSISTPNQEAYRRKIIVLEATEDGVKISKVMDDQSDLREVPEPDNPMADADGNVFYSNVNPIYEMIDMMSATRAYEANVAAFNSSKGMLQAALSIGRV
jgi:flagellar basal-body rod protein FlgC